MGCPAGCSERQWLVESNFLNGNTMNGIYEGRAGGLK
jgi:hypothetical protein